MILLYAEYLYFGLSADATKHGVTRCSVDKRETQLLSFGISDWVEEIEEKG